MNFSMTITKGLQPMLHRPGNGTRTLPLKRETRRSARGETFSASGPGASNATMFSSAGWVTMMPLDVKF